MKLSLYLPLISGVMAAGPPAVVQEYLDGLPEATHEYILKADREMHILGKDSVKALTLFFLINGPDAPRFAEYTDAYILKGYEMLLPTISEMLENCVSRQLDCEALTHEVNINSLRRAVAVKVMIENPQWAIDAFASHGVITCIKLLSDVEKYRWLVDPQNVLTNEYSRENVVERMAGRVWGVVDRLTDPAGPTVGESLANPLWGIFNSYKARCKIL
jgi:hypothetical protein